MNKVVPFLMLVLCASASAQGFECGQLADIGANAYRTKKDGYSLESALQTVEYILANNPQKKQAAEGVVIAIYGDASITSPKQAYDIVYSSCTR
jgi:hypothetical protein